MAKASAKKSASRSSNSAFQAPTQGAQDFFPKDASPPPAPHNTNSQKEGRPPIGEILRAIREKQQKNTREIADALRISERFLIAIESMDRHKLPERVYTLGFVRSYAQHLGVDPQKTVAQYKIEVYDEALHPNLHMAPLERERDVPTNKNLWYAFFASTVIICIAYFLTRTPSQQQQMLLQASKPQSTTTAAPTPTPAPTLTTAPTLDKETPTPSVPLTAAIAPAVTTAPSAPTTTTPPTAAKDTKTVAAPMPATQKPLGEKIETPVTPTTDTKQVTVPTSQISQTPPFLQLTFKEKTWISIRKNEHVMMEKTFLPAENLEIVLDGPILIDTGNAGGFLLKYKDKEISLGKSGQILHRKAISPEILEKGGVSLFGSTVKKLPEVIRPPRYSDTGAPSLPVTIPPALLKDKVPVVNANALPTVGATTSTAVTPAAPFGAVKPATTDPAKTAPAPKAASKKPSATASGSSTDVEKTYVQPIANPFATPLPRKRSSQMTPPAPARDEGDDIDEIDETAFLP